ncbi:SLATT domain-containing protein [Chroococcus sp. FPU101]|uniref:SLATT domain-containing protein n=1 Tax=Chroococcus sp. FPU101 TaxID=1974212 RepID=UPI001A8C92F3|nr:SLATT domain-containing protein [Chroococcus sp. FPU101]GFE71936.1 hypothetical protein CFPU101_45460 [Chroococcus sp. FPU101]
MFFTNLEFMGIKSNKTFEELHRRIDVVTRVRYIAARRLKIHQRLSQWVITLISVILIIIPLLQTFQIKTKVSEQALNVIEVFLGVAILAYSLLLNMENYTSRAEKMQSCGVELTFLKSRIYPYIHYKHNTKLYNQFAEKYNIILEKYENHDDIDYKFFTLEKPQGFSKENFYFAWIAIKIRFWLSFSHYIIVIFILIATIYYIFK